MVLISKAQNGGCQNRVYAAAVLCCSLRLQFFLNSFTGLDGPKSN